MRPIYTDGSLSQYLAEHDMPLEDPGGEPIDEETPDTYQPEDETMSIQEVELPQWQMAEEQPAPIKARVDRLPLTKAATVRLEFGEGGYGVLLIADRSEKGPERETLTDAELQAATLRALLAETERALPALRALVQNLDHPNQETHE